MVALSILETGSTAAEPVNDVILPVARNFYGSSGWVDLDENGDRKPGIFDIWGYTEDSFQSWGQYNGIEIRVNWYDDLLAEAEVTRPGPR
ncbi:hypothetical protein JXL21_13960 [Candidatus Bathyarchaeota archaeon]|nr:hypothetical protein [Candidatus Bathyarchaeota archaeon]